LTIPEALFRTLIQFAPDAFLVTDSAGRIVFANAQAERIFGYERKELVGSHIERLVPDQLRGTHEAHRARYIASPQARPMGIGLQLTARRRERLAALAAPAPLPAAWWIGSYSSLTQGARHDGAGTRGVGAHCLI